MHVVFDVDGVLRDLMAAYVAVLDPPRSVEEITTYQTAIDMAGNVDNFYFFLNRGECWLKAMPFPHMVETYREIGKLGCRLSIASANPDHKGRMDTLGWLARHEILYDGVHFCPDKLILNFDILVEDSPKIAHAAAVAGRAAFLLDRPWTRDVPHRHPNLIRLPPDEEAKDVILDVIKGRGLP